MFAQEYVEWVPEGLDTMEPGHELACVLSAINIDDCSPHDRIRVLQAYEKMRSFYSAEMYRAMNAVADAVDPEDMAADYVEEAAAAEVAAALKLTRRASEAEMDFAVTLKRRLPRVWAALYDGAIDVRRAKVMARGTDHLTTATAQEVVAAIMGDAHRYTTGQLAARLRNLCIDANPGDARDRFDVAVGQRRVTTQADEAGTANIFGLDLAPDRVAQAMSRVNSIAKGLLGENESRTIDQLRADVFLDLLMGSGEDGGTGVGGVHIRVDLATLAGLSEASGDLGGYGPVIADIARQFAQHQVKGRWQWTVYGPNSDQPIATGITRRRPTASQAREVLALNPTCIHPGCRMPSTECDIDHRIPWADSHATKTADLAPLCRHHHVVRHRDGWTYERRDDGDHVFTSPFGHKYTTSGRSP